MEKQVNRDHYFNKKYLNKERFLSFYYQIAPIIKMKPKSVLEIGPGSKVITNLLKEFGIKITTLDIAKDLKPDVIGSVTELRKHFKENSFDLVVCAEVLEHIPFEFFERSLNEISRVTKKNAIISLPYAGPYAYIALRLPLINVLKLHFKIPIMTRHKFNGEHYWEVGKKGYSKRKINSIITKHFKIKQTLNPYDDSYHLFFVLEKRVV